MRHKRVEKRNANIYCHGSAPANHEFRCAKNYYTFITETKRKANQKNAHTNKQQQNPFALHQLYIEI